MRRMSYAGLRSFRRVLTWRAVFFLVLLIASPLLAADTDHCAVCGDIPFGSVYLITDAVSLEKVAVCTNCEALYPNCFLCGLPAKTNATGYVRLPDERSLCARDAKNALLESGQALRICRDVRDELDRVFSRFMSFPETNVTLAMVDRVHLQELFKFAGNDYHCPNVWGYTRSGTNHNQVEHEISLLSGLLPSWFRATCAHEYTHAWVQEHVTAHRRASLGRDAEEGFCELVSYLLMDAERDEAQKAMILRNGYTRGQIDCFVAARNQYGFNDVLDWVLYGADEALSSEDPARVRRLDSQPQTVPLSMAFTTAKPDPVPAPTSLVLKAVFWRASQPVAVINDQSFSPNEEAKVHLAGTNLTVRCLSIRPDAVTVQVAGSPTNQVLVLKRR